MLRVGDGRPRHRPAVIAQTDFEGRELTPVYDVLSQGLDALFEIRPSFAEVEPGLDVQALVLDVHCICPLRLLAFEHLADGVGHGLLM